jgi:hypothetical protein
MSKSLVAFSDVKPSPELQKCLQEFSKILVLLDAFLKRIEAVSSQLMI